MADYYDRDGQPMTVEDWAVKFEDWNYKTVSKTSVGDFDVSTVWLGLNHGYQPEGPILIFETIVFGFGGDEGDPQFRYATEGEARLHHAQVVEALSRGEEIPDA